jgi:hypothetical protein
MRKYILRGAGLLLVIGSLLGIAPTAKVEAQTCACTLQCIQGYHCCTDVAGGQCRQTCIPDSQACPPS